METQDSTIKLSITKTNLLLGLSRVLDCTSTKANMPILCSVLLEAKADQLYLSGTSLDISASTSVKAEVSSEGSIALPAKRLQQIVKEMPEGDINLKVNAHRCTISAGKAVFQLSGYDAKEFPSLRSEVSSNRFECACTQLLGMLNSVSYAVSVAPDRPVLNGVNVSIESGSITVRATNGQRLAVNNKKLDTENTASVTLTNASIPIISRLLADGISVSVGLEESGVCFVVIMDGGTVTVSSSVVQGRFPDTSRVIPSSYIHKITVNREELLSCIRRVSLATDDLKNYLRVSTDGNKLILRAASTTHGEAEESVDCEYSGPGMDMHMSTKSLLDPLSAMSCDTVTIEANELDKPFAIRNDDPGFIYASTPIKAL